MNLHRVCLLSLFLCVQLAVLATVKVNPRDTYQEVEGWGSSLCWWAHMVGQWEDEAKIDAILDSITSPNHLNMNIFRYNIGGGDDPSHYSTSTTKGHMANGKGVRAEMEGFKVTEASDYDWTRDAGQRKVMLKIKERRPDIVFEAFSNSPPYWMTYSGCSSGNSNSNSDNLKPEYYEAFCDYLVAVCKHYKDQYGIEFKTLEPFNESLSNYWGANGGQEGCHFSTATQMQIIRLLYPKLKAAGLNTVISASDETSLGYTKSAINAYMSAGDIYDKVGQINTHTYSGSDIERADVRRLAKQAGKTLWQSETGPMDMGGTATEINIQLGQLLFRDMNIMQPTAWIDWQMFEEWNDTWCQFRGNFENETYKINKNYYVRKQVTRFIKQGYTIIGSPEPANILMALSPNRDELVISLINRSGEEQTYDFDLSEFYDVGSTAKVFETSNSNSENCAAKADITITDNVFSYTAPNTTVTTFVISAKPIVYDGFKLIEGITFEDSSIDGFSGANVQLLANPVIALLNGSTNSISFSNGTLAYELESEFLSIEDYRYLHVMVYALENTTLTIKEQSGEFLKNIAVTNGWKDVVLDLMEYDSIEKLEFTTTGTVYLDNLIVNDISTEWGVLQEPPYYDFESSEGTPLYSFSNSQGKKASASVVKNPDYAALNPIGNVLEYFVPSVTNVSIPEDTLIISLPSPFFITEESQYLHVMVKSPTGKMNVIVGSAKQQENFEEDTWVDLVIDLSSLNGEIIREIKLSSYGKTDVNTLVYIDNIRFNDEKEAEKYVYRSPNGMYVVVSKNSGNVLSVDDDGVLVQELDRSFEDENQKWIIKPEASNYTIKNSAINVYATDDTAYYLQMQEEVADWAGQLYAISETDGGYVKIVSVLTDKVFDIEGQSVNAGARVGLWSFGLAGNDHRQWSLIELERYPDVVSVPDFESSDIPFLYSRNGKLFVGGFEGEIIYEVYNANGMLLKTANGIAPTANLIAGKGLYFVRLKTDRNTYYLKGLVN